MEDYELWLFGICGVLALLAFIFSIRKLREFRAISDTPTSKCKGVFIGVTEVKGTAESEEPLRSFLAGCNSVFYRYDVSERWSRVVVETYEENGKTKTRTRHETGWETVAEDSCGQPFYIKDDTGVVLIDPFEAKIDDEVVFSRTVGNGDSLYYSKGPVCCIPDSDGVRRFTESAVRLHKKLYVLGYARERTDCVAPVIGREPGYRFLISVRSEEELVGRGKWAYALLTFLFAFFTIGPFIFAHLQWNSCPLASAIYAGGGVVLLLFLSTAYELYNNFVSLRNRVQQAQSLIDVQLKRRYDLIPALVSTVTGFQQHEASCQEYIAELRTMCIGEGVIRAVEPQIMLLIENYPELQAGNLFLKLQKELSDTEDRIAMASDYMNEITTTYNTKIESFPGNILAGLIGAHTLPLLTIENFERKAINVNFK